MFWLRVNMKRIWNRDKGMSERRKWNWCGGDYFDSRCIDRAGHHFLRHSSQSSSRQFSVRLQVKVEKYSRSFPAGVETWQAQMTVMTSLMILILMTFAAAILESASLQTSKNIRWAVCGAFSRVGICGVSEGTSGGV